MVAVGVRQSGGVVLAAASHQRPWLRGAVRVGTLLGSQQGQGPGEDPEGAAGGAYPPPPFSPPYSIRQAQSKPGVRIGRTGAKVASAAAIVLC